MLIDVAIPGDRMWLKKKPRRFWNINTLQ
jgi:hypothetical protein